MVYIIVRGKENNIKRLKGKTVTEFAKNLENEGWTSEFVNEEERDRVKHQEKRDGHSLQKGDASKIKGEIGIDGKHIERISHKLGLEKFAKGYPK